MQIVGLTSAALIILAVFVGAMAWQIRDSLETSIEYQSEILAELVHARTRSGDLRASESKSTPVQEVQTLRSEAQHKCFQISVPAAKV
jgi:hypothetical protein